MSFLSWLGIRARTSRTRRRATCKLRFEPLEDRSLLAAGLSASLLADVVPGPDSSYAMNLTNWNGTLASAQGANPHGGPGWLCHRDPICK